MPSRVSQAADLPIVLTHVPLDQILHDTDALMDEHASFGCKNIGLGSIPLDYLKDYNIQWTKNADLAPVYESVGYGNLDFNAIVSKMKEAGTEYFLVEQDNAANLPDTLHQVERSIRYILSEL